MNNQNFTHTRIILTLWYSVILLIILSAFSVALYTIENRNFTRIVIQRDFGASIPSHVSPDERKIILQQVKELRRSFVTTILFIDSIVLIIGGGLSFLLADKTLRPIQLSLQKQKEFLADASHELRTPLAAIQTASEVILRGKSKTKEDYKRVVQQTYDETKRLGQMANDLLELSRIDSGNSMLHKETVQVDSIAHIIVSEIKPLLRQKNIVFKTTIAENVIINGDKNRIKQLFFILLDNAIKFTPEHGTITLSVKNKPKPTITVTDTGIGIDPKEQKRIFERFYQSDPSRTATGAGLGLSIAKWITEAHQGSIKVKSEKGKGSIFRITFPNS